MINATEYEEKQYLNYILKMLNEELHKISEGIVDYSKKIHETKSYMWDNIYELDPAEIASSKESVSQAIDIADNKLVQKKKIDKLIISPYFGRMDFLQNDKIDNLAVYVGIHAFIETETFRSLIYDWRAPISSMFYNFEIGKASYIVIDDELNGEILLKRQYKIKNSVMEYMIESSLTINDEILQKELSNSSDERMKNIVATIQKEQNLIIRNEASNVLIIQGVAGSGKTSIAMHRVAYLLYEYRDILFSRNILIISPNKVFSDYISQVLPQLGEEEIEEITFEEIALNEIGKIFKFQTFYQQVLDIIDTADSESINRMKYKSTVDFVDDLDRYICYIDKENFIPRDIKITNKLVVSKEYLLNRYNTLRAFIPTLKRCGYIAEDVIEKLEIDNNIKLTREARSQIKLKIKNMFKINDILLLYSYFYEWIEMPSLYTKDKSRYLEYSDVFPVVYLKINLEGTKNFDFVKHLIVDEMQDYTPIQYAVLSKLFKCNKTILGDRKQSINPYNATSHREIKKIFKQAEIVTLFKSYRSTVEIMKFAQRIFEDKDIIAIERHGTEPTIIQCKYDSDQIFEINKLIKDFNKSGYNSLCVICKNQSYVNAIFNKIDNSEKNIYIITSDSNEFKSGIILTTVYMAKGLEFDQVIVPFACKDVYNTELDRRLLYIACTRSMHKLDILFFGEKTSFLDI